MYRPGGRSAALYAPFCWLITMNVSPRSAFLSLTNAPTNGAPLLLLITPLTAPLSSAACASSNSKSRYLDVLHSIFWVLRSSGGIVKVAMDWMQTVQDGKTT